MLAPGAPVPPDPLPAGNPYIAKIQPICQLVEYLLDQAHTLGLKAGIAILVVIALSVIIAHEWSTLSPPPAAVSPAVTVPEKPQQPVEPAPVKFVLI